MISRVEMGGRSSCQRHFYQWIINHYIHPGSICGSITTYPPGPPMIHWISAGLKAKSFRFPFFLVGIPFFFLQHCKWTTLTTRKKQQKTTYRCFLKIHDSDLFFQNSSDRERIFTAGSLLSYFHRSKDGPVECWPSLLLVPNLPWSFSKMWFVSDVLWTKNMGWGRIL